MNKPSHCCQLMHNYIEDKRMPIDYSPRVREYYLTLRYSPAVQGINYCPWCGITLPTSLRNEFFELLEKEYNIDDPFSQLDSNLFPEEFKSNLWWKKRGL